MADIKELIKPVKITYGEDERVSAFCEGFTGRDCGCSPHSCERAFDCRDSWFSGASVKCGGGWTSDIEAEDDILF